jgi:hypothetical protein
VLAELHALAGRLGVAVRAEPFGKGLLQGRGGLCWVDGKALVVMDEKLSVLERVAVLAEALTTFELDAVGMPPAVRELLATRVAGRRRSRKKRTVPDADPKPPPRSARHAAHAGHAGRPGLARARPRAGPRAR